MFKEVSTWLIILLAIGTLCFAHLYKNSIEDLALAEKTATDLRLEIESANKRILEQQTKITTLESQKQKSQAEFRKTKTVLDGLKGRQSTVKAKPVLVERKIQTSFDSFMKDIQCVTGATEQC